MLILENQNSEQQHEQVKQFIAMMAAATVGMKKNNEEADDNDGGSGSGSTKEKLIQYNHEHVKQFMAMMAERRNSSSKTMIVQNDAFSKTTLGYLPFSTIANCNRCFITQGVYDCIKVEINEHDFYSIGDYDVTGHPTICIDAKLLIILATGMLQMCGLIIFRSESLTRCLCAEIFCNTHVQRTTLCE